MNATATAALRFESPLEAPSATGVRVPIRTAIAVQGWTCDRTRGGMAGSGFLAERAAAEFGLGLRRIGTPGPAADLGWREALDRAAPTLVQAARVVRDEVEAGGLPFAFLNRCGTSLATLPPVIAANPDAVLVWVDAHGDYNTPATTPTGYLGGMVISALCGLWESGHGAGLAPDCTILVGTRDLDPPEGALLRRDRIAIVKGAALDLDVGRILQLIDGRPVILHIDLDVIDPAYLPAEYAIAGGLHPGALRRLVRTLAASLPIAGVELSEFELPSDPDQAACAAATVIAIIEPLFA